MKYSGIFLLTVFCLFFSGCADRPEVDPKTYGQVVDHLPSLAEAERPFAFPHDAVNDHKNCVFKEEDFF